jgi:hypothetical protein
MNEEVKVAALSAGAEAWKHLYPGLADDDGVVSLIVGAVLGVVQDVDPSPSNMRVDPNRYLDSFWRDGRHAGRTLYAQVDDGPTRGDVVIGMLDTPELAERVVKDHNRLLGPRPLLPVPEVTQGELMALAEAFERTAVTQFVSRVVDVPERLISGPEAHDQSIRTASGAVRYPHLLYQVMLQPDGKLALFDHGTKTFVAYNSTPDSVLGHLRAVSREATSQHALRTIASVLTGEQPMVGAIGWDQALQLDEENAGHSWPALKQLDTADFEVAPALAEELFGPVPKEYLGGEPVVEREKSYVSRPCPQEDL